MKPGKLALLPALALAATTTACNSGVGTWEILMILGVLGAMALGAGALALVVVVAYRWFKRRADDHAPPDEDSP